MKTLPIWRAWEEIEATLDACTSTADEIRWLSLEEITELIQLQDEMEKSALLLKDRLRAAAAPTLRTIRRTSG